jgi:phosphate transporter
VTGVMNMSREDSAELVLKSMVNSTTVLILGGYSISAALSRCEIELRIAAAIQRAFGHQPRIFILSIMLLGMFLSMLISNHTAPVLLSSILIPVVRDCGNGSSFARTLLLGLAVRTHLQALIL